MYITVTVLKSQSFAKPNQEILALKPQQTVTVSQRQRCEDEGAACRWYSLLTFVVS